MNDKPSCPKCKCAEVIKFEKVTGNQRFQCKNCSFQFTRLTPRGHSDSIKALAVVLYTLGLSMNVIGKMFIVSAQSILNWVRNFAIANYEKPAPKDAIIVELDDMWHFLNSKKQIWIWKAYCRETGELIDWECGSRDKKTFLELWNRLLKWNTEMFCSDEYKVYIETIPEEKLLQSKSQTIYLEQNNGRQRHWFARFKRRSIVISKSLQMLDLTMALFARFHVNGSWKEIMPLFC